MENGGSRATGRGPAWEHGDTMNPLLRSALLSALLLSTVATAEEAAPAPAGEIQTEFIKRIVVPRYNSPPRARASHDANIRNSPARTPAWMLSRMPVLVPDGTPQLVYRAPSAERGSPDFGG